MKPEDKDKLMQAQSQKVLDGMKPIWEAHFLNDAPVSGGFMEWLKKAAAK